MNLATPLTPNPQPLSTTTKIREVVCAHINLLMHMRCTEELPPKEGFPTHNPALPLCASDPAEQESRAAGIGRLTLEAIAVAAETVVCTCVKWSPDFRDSCRELTVHTDHARLPQGSWIIPRHACNFMSQLSTSWALQHDLCP